MKLVQPKVFLLGYTAVDQAALQSYLDYVGCSSFLGSFADAVNSGINPGEALCSLYAKLCYKSLTTEGNDNVSRVRDIESNLRSCFDTGHGSVFEHCNLNFVITDCSRVFTHELVRHRVGSAFSQTSGRYVRSENLNMVLEDPLASKLKTKDGALLLDVMAAWARQIEGSYNDVVKQFDWEAMKMVDKKKLTSYLRRNLPNGQANEIGVTLNIRSLRHLVQMRTGRHAEWEVRQVFGQVYELVKDKFPLLFHGAKVEKVGGLNEISGMKMQPYEDISHFSDEEFNKEVERRRVAAEQAGA